MQGLGHDANSVGLAAHDDAMALGDFAIAAALPERLGPGMALHDPQAHPLRTVLCGPLFDGAIQRLRVTRAMPAGRDNERAHVPDAGHEQVRDDVGHGGESAIGALIAEHVLVREWVARRQLAVDFFLRLAGLRGDPVHGEEVERVGLEERLKAAFPIDEKVDHLQVGQGRRWKIHHILHERRHRMTRGSRRSATAGAGWPTRRIEPDRRSLPARGGPLGQCKVLAEARQRRSAGAGARCVLTFERTPPAGRPTGGPTAPPSAPLRVPCGARSRKGPQINSPSNTTERSCLCQARSSDSICGTPLRGATFRALRSSAAHTGHRPACPQGLGRGSAAFDEAHGQRLSTWNRRCAR